MAVIKEGFFDKETVSLLQKVNFAKIQLICSKDNSLLPELQKTPVELTVLNEEPLSSGFLLNGDEAIIVENENKNHFLLFSKPLLLHKEFVEKFEKLKTSACS